MRYLLIILILGCTEPPKGYSPKAPAIPRLREFKPEEQKRPVDWYSVATLKITKDMTLKDIEAVLGKPTVKTGPIAWYGDLVTGIDEKGRPTQQPLLKLGFKEDGRIFFYEKYRVWEIPNNPTRITHEGFEFFR